MKINITERKCGECTLCCLLFEIRDINKKRNEVCIHCSKNGCDIYNTRPDCCRGFDCAYLQSNNKNIELRPDKCGIIFERVGDHVFFGLQDPRKELKDIALKQIKSFLIQGFSVIIENKGGRKIYMNKEHSKELVLQEYNNFVESR